MPRLSDTMSEGAISQWLKKPGDKVEAGDIIAEIETDKAVMELEAFGNGTLLKIMVAEGQIVPIGTPIALVGEGEVDTEIGSGKEPDKTSAPSQASSEPSSPERTQPSTQTEPVKRDPGERIRISPLARRMAKDQGIDLRQLQGSGPSGRIIKKDIEEFQKRGSTIETRESKSLVGQPGEIVPMNRMRRAIARAMTDAQPGTPHIYLSVEIDMGKAEHLRQQINESAASKTRISVNDMVVKAVAKALSELPDLNSSYMADHDGQPAIQRYDQINISIAVAIEDGLVTPVVRDVDKKTLGALALEIRELAGRAREGKLRQNEIEGAGFQVSNLGMFGIVNFTSIIPSPLAASLSVGMVRKVPVVRDGELAVGEIMEVTLSADHRVADGAVAAHYLQELKRILEAPMSLLL